MDLAAILAILQLAGTETPAFIALFNEVKAAFGTSDQATLQKMLDDANAQADAQYNASEGTASS